MCCIMLMGWLVALQGGMEAERAERQQLGAEEDAQRRAHQEAFDAMVAAAKAAPPADQRWDPMRFRAYPPGWYLKIGLPVVLIRVG